MHVVAGVLVDGNGRVLIAQRPPGKHLAGLWEFPGGKLESGESAMSALERELDEELGIAVDPHTFEALIRIPWRYGERAMLLEAMVVRAWTGEPKALDAAAIAWRDPASIDPTMLAPADRPILAALRLPLHYLVSPAGAPPDRVSEWIAEALARGERLMQVHLPGHPDDVVRSVVAGALAEVRRHGAHVLLYGDVEGAEALSVGVHLDSSQLRGWTERPLPLGTLVAASCHDADDLAHAVRLGCDFATLSPVLAGSASGHEPLGWPRFARLAEAASLPVYALGGVGADDLGEARMHAAQGIAGMS
ncbi:Nudix family hydrolase [Luteibacter sp. UNCMF366Tsu5.1]|uniref:Nudix family hydrolase n=1 Tax=Luteibacter sp. UNCMF366Tsu5.1 TaxID=1502758 RepID=UPI0009084C62|nr:Nudix family hydrolase [Luteibacter sp. UNCMF366Tsu5.1]SFW35698.1 8-oxo-dGTP diphosphatase [Luteibacter sp. UNCMF366Tsu5.1]